MSRPISQRWRSDVASLCLDGGIGLLESGAETSRVEETIAYLACAYGVPVESMVTPTGLTVSVGEEETTTRIARVHRRSIDLDKVTRLNELSRELVVHKVDLEQALTRVEDIRHAPAGFGRWTQLLAAALGGLGYTALAGGTGAELLAGALAGLLVRLLGERFGQAFPPFVTTSLAAFVATLWATLNVALLGLDSQKIVLGAILPLMPGLALVSSVRDLMAGELVSGLARGAEAMLTASAIAVGVLMGLSLQRSWGL